MKKIVLSFSFLFLFIAISSAQIAVFKPTVFVDSISQPGLKKYGIKLRFDGINTPVIFVSQTLASIGAYMYGDSLPNIANSINPNTSVICVAYNANNTNELISFIAVNLNSSNVLTLPTLLSSNGSNCDGEIQVAIDTVNFNVISPTISIDVLNGGQLSSANSNFFTFNNLCSNQYKISVAYTNTATNSLSSSFANVLLGPYAFPSSTGLNVQIDPYKDANTPTCDGKARVSVTNSVVPYLLAFDGGGYTNCDSILNLCEGMHTVRIKTANDSLSKYFIVSGNSVINNTNPFGSVLDTIIYNFTNCNFNYNLPIDSAFLSNYIAIVSNTVFFSWQLWQQGTLTTVSDTMSYTYLTGNNMVSLIIFCGNARTANGGNFKTFRINDYAYLSNTATTIKSLYMGGIFDLFPNPFTSSISIKSKLISDIKSIEMVNVIGELMDVEVCSNSQEIILDTDYLKSGFYTISIISSSGQKSSYKVIKP